MRNPYIVGRYVRGKDFYGRSDLIEDVLGSADNAIWVIGKRRIGKTSFLRQLEHISDSAAESSGGSEQSHIAIFCDLQGLTTIDDLSEELFYAIEDKQEQFQNMGLGVSDLEGKDAFRIFRSIERASRRAETNVLLLFDEAEALIEFGEKDPSSLQKLRKAMQQGSGFKTVLTATKALSELNDLCREWKTSPFLFGFASKYIAGISEADADKLIRQINHPKPVKVALGTAERVKLVTGNEPFLIQRVCEQLFQADGSLRKITDDDLVLGEMLADFLQIDYNDLSPTERAILRHLSSMAETSESDLSQAAITGAAETLTSFLHGLCNLGYVKKLNEKYSIANHFLRIWLHVSGPKEIKIDVSDEATQAMHNANRTFVTDLPLKPDSTVYIEREQDDQLLDLVSHTNFIVLLGPKQTGKTTLLRRLAHRATMRSESDSGASLDFKPIYIDISQLANVSKTEWYNRVCDCISKQVSDPSLSSSTHLAIPLSAIEYRGANDIAEIKTLLGAIADENDAIISAKETTSLRASKIVVMLDGVNAENTEADDQNVVALREVYRNVIFAPEISHKFSFILAGSFDPCSLITTRGASSLTTSHEVMLVDFDLQSVKNLAEHLNELGIPASEGVMERIYYWTSGHPYLTLKLCSLIETSLDLSGRTSGTEKEVNNETIDRIVSNLLSQGDDHVNYVVDILHSDSNLPQVVRNMLSWDRTQHYKAPSSEPSDPECAQAAGEIGKAGDVEGISPSPQSPTNMEAWQTKLTTCLPILTRVGLLKRKEDGSYEIRNNIYKEALLKLFFPPSSRSETLTPATDSDSLSNKPSLGRIDEYELIEELGTGGQGTVYKARELFFPLDRFIAVKVLKLTSESAVERFKHEVRAASRISHQNIIKIFRVGKHWEEDNYFFVMECFNDNLAKHVGNGKSIPPKKTVDLIIQVVDALRSAHESNILHRDLKPSNILLDKAGRPILSDFGCALIVDLQRTPSGTAVGTYPYMAPEQIENASQTDQRSDLYSIGVILFEAITGRLPFEAETISELKVKIQAGAPSAAQVAADPKTQSDGEPEAIPNSLDHLISKLLEKDPHDRYQSSRELLQGLEIIRGGFMPPFSADSPW